jgi:hypothetical protein
MKKLFFVLMVAGLVMAGSGTTLVLAQTTYDLYATPKDEYQLYTSNFALRYLDLDGDQKFSMDEELISFSGVTFGLVPVTYTEILGVPNSNFDSPYTDGPNPMFSNWYFNKPSNVITTVYINPNVWTYSQVPVSSGVSVSIPGISVAQDQEGDLLLRRCDGDHPGIPCSLYPGAPSDLVLPGYFDIKNAKIMQHGPKYVDLFIALYEPIPPVPPYPPVGFVNYFWQFEGGCVAPPNKLKKAGVSFIWNVNVGAWKANWYVITQCNPRAVEQGEEITSFEFTADGIKVRVALDDLKEALNEDGKLTWQAGVRWVPFIYPNGCTPPNCWNSVAVDYAPDILGLLPCFPALGPCSWKPELPATWEPR